MVLGNTYLVFTSLSVVLKINSVVEMHDEDHNTVIWIERNLGIFQEGIITDPSAFHVHKRWHIVEFLDSIIFGIQNLLFAQPYVFAPDITEQEKWMVCLVWIFLYLRMLREKINFYRTM